MNILKTNYLLLFIGLSILSSGQSRSKQAKYAYLIYTYLNPGQRPTLLDNRVTGVADTSQSFIYGQIVDSNNIPLPMAVVTLKTASMPQDSFSIRSDKNGYYQLFVKPEHYNITIERTTPFYLNHIYMGSGQRRQINVKLRGFSNAGYITTYFRSNKLLSDKQIRKKEQELDRDYKSLVEVR